MKIVGILFFLLLSSSLVQAQDEFLRVYRTSLPLGNKKVIPSKEGGAVLMGTTDIGLVDTTGFPVWDTWLQGGTGIIIDLNDVVICDTTIICCGKYTNILHTGGNEVTLVLLAFSMQGALLHQKRMVLNTDIDYPLMYASSDSTIVISGAAWNAEEKIQSYFLSMNKELAIKNIYAFTASADSDRIYSPWIYAASDTDLRVLFGRSTVTNFNDNLLYEGRFSLKNHSWTQRHFTFDTLFFFAGSASGIQPDGSQYFRGAAFGSSRDYIYWAVLQLDKDFQPKLCYRLSNSLLTNNSQKTTSLATGRSGEALLSGSLSDYQTGLCLVGQDATIKRAIGIWPVDGFSAIPIIVPIDTSAVLTIGKLQYVTGPSGFTLGYSQRFTTALDGCNSYPIELETQHVPVQVTNDKSSFFKDTILRYTEVPVAITEVANTIYDRFSICGAFDEVKVSDLPSLVSVFPNPVKKESVVFFVADDLPYREYHLILRQSTGAIAYEANYYSSGQQSFAIPTTSLASGLYVIELCDASTFTIRSRAKVIVQ